MQREPARPDLVPDCPAGRVVIASDPEQRGDRDVPMRQEFCGTTFELVRPVRILLEVSIVDKGPIELVQLTGVHEEPGVGDVGVPISEQEPYA